jgi:hypothetical protein
MLSKCANPNCSSTFLHLHDGKLFRWETQISNRNPTEFGADPTLNKSARHIEFFWLCQSCAASMTLQFQRGVGIVAIEAPPIVVPARAMAAARGAL